MRLVAKSTLGNCHIAAIKKESSGNPTIYVLINQDKDTVAQVQLQDGAPPENGFCIEDLLTVALDRIRHLNSELSSQHNLDALDHIDAALLALDKRMKERTQGS